MRSLNFQSLSAGQFCLNFQALFCLSAFPHVKEWRSSHATLNDRRVDQASANSLQNPLLIAALISRQLGHGAVIRFRVKADHAFRMLHPTQAGFPSLRYFGCR